MEISKALLSQIQVPEYEEYRDLQTRENRYRDNLRAAVAGALILVMIVAAGCGIYAAVSSNASEVACFSPLILGLVFCVAAILIDKWVNPISQFLLNRLPSRFFDSVRHEELVFRFTPVEGSIEAEAKLILDKLNAEIENRSKQNHRIYQDLRLKRVWRDWYANDLERVLRNEEEDEAARIILEKCLDAIRDDSDSRGTFARTLLRLESSGISSLIKHKVGNLRFSSAGSTSTRYSQVPKRDGASKNLNEETSRSHNRSGPSQHANSNNDRVATLKSDPTHIPRQRQLKHKKIRNVSQEFYERLAATKGDVGRRGELIALHYEASRIRTEEGPKFLARLEHSSKVVGDGLGYDIRSVRAGEDIFIEVKTTVGPFWSNLFFTENEYRVMKELGEAYWLIRICNLDLKTNEGEIFVFDGSSMITDFFEFDANVYALRDKGRRFT